LIERTAAVRAFHDKVAAVVVDTKGSPDLQIRLWVLRATEGAS
jgi:hypothetical protein